MMTSRAPPSRTAGRSRWPPSSAPRRAGCSSSWPGTRPPRWPAAARSAMQPSKSVSSESTRRRWPAAAPAVPWRPCRAGRITIAGMPAAARVGGQRGRRVAGRGAGHGPNRLSLGDHLVDDRHQHRHAEILNEPVCELLIGGSSNGGATGRIPRSAEMRANNGAAGTNRSNGRAILIPSISLIRPISPIPVARPLESPLTLTALSGYNRNTPCPLRRIQRLARARSLPTSRFARHRPERPGLCRVAGMALAGAGPLVSGPQGQGRPVLRLHHGAVLLRPVPGRQQSSRASTAAARSATAEPCISCGTARSGVCPICARSASACLPCRP